MKQELLNAGVLAGSFLVLFALAELLYHKAKVRVELTRKLVHTGTGFLTLLFPLLLADHWLVLFLCTSFALILIVSIKFNLLSSINAIERKSYGSILYPVSVYACYLVYELNHYSYYYFYIPILVLAISDPLAALCGKQWPLGKYQAGSGYKTATGSVVFFISAALTGYLVLAASGFYNLPLVIVLALVTTLAEGLSKNGFDNLTVPLSALIVLMAVGSL